MPLTCDSNDDDKSSPSRPLLKEPPQLEKAEETLSKSHGNPRVTAMAIAAENAGDTVHLYTGHVNGTLKKWNLSTNTVLWSIQAHKDWTRDEAGGADYNFFNFKRGIRGIAVTHDEATNQHCIFTWPFVADTDKRPFEVLVWKGTDGSFCYRIACQQVGRRRANNAFPTISCLVICSLRLGSEWVESVLVGLEATSTVLDYNDDYDDFDLEDAQQECEGNIVPFRLRDRRQLESWRGHPGAIRAMAVVPSKYLVSLSVQSGHSEPEMVILWSLDEPGIPIHRLDFCSGGPNANPPFCELVGGIAAHGSKLLLCGDYGDMLIPIDLEDGRGRPNLKMRGVLRLGQRHYEDSSFHGHLSSSGNTVAVVNEGEIDVLLFPIDSLGDNAGLSQVFDYNEADKRNKEEKEHEHQYAKSLALGKVAFPHHGGFLPKKRKRDDQLNAEPHSSTEPAGNAFGGKYNSSGGPEVLALNGNVLVGAFGNGTIVKAPLLSSSVYGSCSKEYGLLGSCGGNRGSAVMGKFPHLGVDAEDKEQEGAPLHAAGRRPECIIQ